MSHVVRLLLVTLVGGLALHAAPPLVRIQDVLYRADGTRFHGSAMVEWNTFQAADGSTVPAQSVTVRITDGVLSVLLVPSTNALPPTQYLVRYESGGRLQFTERWSVPPSNVTLLLRDVRSTTTTGGGNPPATPTPVPLSGVAGLQTELNLRPRRSLSYAPSRLVMADGQGALAAVAGAAEECVRVDGTSVPCAAPAPMGPGFVDQEEPAGLVNGTNTVFTLGGTPSPASSLQVHRNGVLQRMGLDYALTDNQVTFATASTPQPGDLLAATYRLADGGQPAGQAGGALTGTYPNPALAEGVVRNAQVAADAAIAEPKLALQFPTHSNRNDPSDGEKGALAGTTGVPSGTNRYVTNQDARLSDARPPSGHGLLGTGHTDTVAATPQRGDVIVGQGSPAAWTRLALGPANRCLMSNGSDAVWNSCLFTGFPLGSIPFVDELGNLAQSVGRLAWDNANRRLSVGTNRSLATLFLHDATPGTGATSLAVRSGQAQGTTALTTWSTDAGDEVARVGADGAVTARSVSVTGGNGPTWREAGLAQEPTGVRDGDAWHSQTGQARRSVAAGMVNTTPQVLCGQTGQRTTSGSPVLLGSCRIPEELLRPGDRLELRYDLSGGGRYDVQVRWSGTPVKGHTATGAPVSATASVGVHNEGTQWGIRWWGVAGGVEGEVVALAATAGVVVLEWTGAVEDAGVDWVALRQFTVLRYPAQANP